MKTGEERYDCSTSAKERCVPAEFLTAPFNPDRRRAGGPEPDQQGDGCTGSADRGQGAQTHGHLAALSGLRWVHGDPFANLCPDVAQLILDVISLDYHETLMADSGAQADAALRSAIADNVGKYVLVVEEAIPARGDGVYIELGGRPALEVAKSGRTGSSGDRHRLLRIVGWRSLG